MTEQQILKKIDKLNEDDHIQAVVDFIEKLPHKDKTTEVLSELGRAYNNLYWQKPSEANEKYLKKAVEVFKYLEEEIGDTESWNYRIGYSYFYLNNIEESKKHLEKSSAVPGAQELLHYIGTRFLGNGDGAVLFGKLDGFAALDLRLLDGLGFADVFVFNVAFGGDAFQIHFAFGGDFGFFRLAFFLRFLLGDAGFLFGAAHGDFAFLFEFGVFFFARDFQAMRISTAIIGPITKSTSVNSQLV